MSRNFAQKWALEFSRGKYQLLEFRHKAAPSAIGGAAYF